MIRRRWVIAAVGIWVLSACGGSTGDGSAERGGAARPPGSSESGGPAWDAARTSVDGTAVVLVFTGGPEFDPTDPCSFDYRADISESAASVTIGLLAIRPPVPSDGEVACAALGHPRRLQVQLAGPLAGRPLIERTSGSARPVFDGSTLLEPAWVPEGWTFRGEGVAYPLADVSQAWSRGWGPEGADPFACSPALSVVQGTASAIEQLPDVMGGGTELGRHDIAGATAVHTRNAERFAERLTWMTGDTAVAVLATTCGPDPVDLDSLLQFARSLS